MRVSRTFLGEHCGEVPLCYSTLCQRNEVKYSFIAQYKKIWPMILMCHVLGVKSNNFYSFQKCKASTTDVPTHQEMIGWVKRYC